MTTKELKPWVCGLACHSCRSIEPITQTVLHRDLVYCCACWLREMTLCEDCGTWEPVVSITIWEGRFVCPTCHDTASVLLNILDPFILDTTDMLDWVHVSGGLHQTKAVVGPTTPPSTPVHQRPKHLLMPPPRSKRRLFWPVKL